MLKRRTLFDTVVRWKRAFTQTGELHDRKIQDRGHLRIITEESLERFLQENASANQNEMAEYFGCKFQSIQVTLKKFGYSRKKLQSYHEADDAKRAAYLGKSPT